MSIFFSPDTATYLSAVNGESIALRYEIVEENSDEFWIRIRYLARGDKGADGEPFIIKFTDDRKGFSPHPSSAPEVLQYVYVNDRQFPEELP